MVTFPATVLLATDGSSHSANARRAAAEITTRGGASLHLVHAWHRTGGPLALPHDTSHDSVAVMLSHESDLLAASGATVAATHAPDTGWPAERILAVARGIGADLLVIGSRRLGRLHRAVVPPITDALLRLTTIPLLVVHDDPGAWPPARIVAGDDGSRVAQDAAILAARLGQVLGCPVDTVSILDPEVVAVPAPTRAMAAVLERIDRRAAEVGNEVGTSPGARLLFHQRADTGLQEAGAGGATPAIIAVGHRGARRPGEQATPSVAARLLADGGTTLLVCPSAALRLIRRRRAPLARVPSQPR